MNWLGLKQACALLLIATALFGCSTPAEVEPTGAVLLEIERSGPRVNQDGELAGLLRGDAAPDADLIRAAGCHNAVRWLQDESLNTSLVISTSSRLVRIAEILAGEDVNSDLVVLAETSFWNGSDLEVLALEAGFSTEEVRDFETLVAQQPTEQSLRRFVVYVSSETTSRQAIIYLDGDRLVISSAASLAGPEPTLDPEIAGIGPYIFETSECSVFETFE